MRSVTLSQMALKPHSLPPCPKPHKPHSTFSLLPLNSLSKKLSSKFFFRNQSLIFSRYPKKWCENPIEEAFRHVLPTASKNLDGLEVRGLDCQNVQATTESMLDLDDFCGSLAKYNSTREYQKAASTKSYGGWLKFVLLFGYLTLQGSHQALAGTDFASGFQSIPYLGDFGDISTGFASAFLLIFFSELGDKTFFIAALLAARNSAAIVFTGTFGALAAMTIISVVLGRSFHYIDEILPFKLGETDLPVDDIAAVCLLVYFGVSTLIDASSSDSLKAEDEQKEVKFQAELAVSEFSGNGAGILAAANTIVSTFLLVFVAEWGDKSFFSTVALAAASSPIGVIGGALAGHGVATLIAVLGGSLLGTYLSEKPGNSRNISYHIMKIFLV
ncbi:GDT1-like protein 1, chloroplastic isoform X3 [Manihot esculenta]|uniref:GDT1-like protein 1, chloroplastic isoform X3 n=1 Tax=Manihot esculenta TaxID=3983 RepID=UPI001CC59F33|nr:GDT1-like protein 1, chloroplastic isoform X3 [Manihot esculenta]